MRNALLTVLGAALLATAKKSKSSGSASNFDVMLRRMGLQDGKIKIRVQILYSPPYSEYDRSNPKLFLELPSWLEQASDALEGMWSACIENDVDFDEEDDVYEIVRSGMYDLCGDELDDLGPHLETLSSLNNISSDPSDICFPERIEVISDTEVKDEYDFDEFCNDIFEEYKDKASKIINDGPEDGIKEYLLGLRRGHNDVFIDWDEFIESEYWPEIETKKSIVDGLREYFSYNAEEVIPNETYYGLWDHLSEKQGFTCDFVFNAKTTPSALDKDSRDFYYILYEIVHFSMQSYNDYVAMTYSNIDGFGSIENWEILASEPSSLPANKKTESQLRRF